MANSLAHTKWVCKYHIVFTPKISEENNLQSVAQGYYANTEGLMQMERDRDNRREHDARPCAYAGIDSTQI